MASVEDLRTDLSAEQTALDSMLGLLKPADWDRDTPAEGWTIKDTISHLAFYDEAATVAVEEPDLFEESLEMIEADIQAFLDEPLERGRAMTPDEVQDWWWESRNDMLLAFETLEEGQRVKWYGPSMSAASFITARLMEVWAHGQDIADAMNLHRRPTDRLKHVAHIGIKALPFSFANNGLAPPSEDVSVRLTSHIGEVWSWGTSRDDRVSGSAEDFCLVVTQRRHVDDTDLVVEGPVARRWIDIAQAFAGPPGKGRRPGQFPKRHA